MEQEWSFRVTPANTDDWEGKCLNVSMSMAASFYLAAKETGSESGNDHIHVVIRTTKTRSQLDYAVKQAFSVSGSAQIQIQSVKGNKGHGSFDKACRYVCKGASPMDLPVILLAVGSTSEDHARWHDEYWAVYNAGESSRAAASRAAPRGAAKPTIYDQLKELCKDCTSQQAVVDVCCEWYESINRHVNYHCFKDVVRKLAVEKDRMSAEDFKARLLMEIM